MRQVTVLVKDAKAAARRWVVEEAAAAPGFRGAYLHGSTARLPDDAALPATSDLDVMVVLAAGGPPPPTGKIRYRDVLLDVSAPPRPRDGRTPESEDPVPNRRSPRGWARIGEHPRAPDSWINRAAGR